MNHFKLPNFISHLTNLLPGALILFVLLAFSIQESAGQIGDPPDLRVSTCQTSCSAGDFEIIEVFLSADMNGTPLPNTCNPGDDVMAYVCVTFTNGSGSDRAGIQLEADLVINGSTTQIIHCDPTVTNQETITLCVTDPIMWTCGQEVELKNIFFAWLSAASGPNICEITDCNEHPNAKCNNETPDLIVTTPLIADFSFRVACDGGSYSTVSFTDETTGGTPAYTYDWQFGDGGSSTAQNPMHTYASAGTFEVTLTVTDSDDPAQVDSEVKEVTVIACCDLEVKCPVDATYPCDDIPQDLFAAGGGEILNQCGQVTIKDNFQYPGPCGMTEVIFTICDDNGTPDNHDDDIIKRCTTKVTTEDKVPPAPPDPPADVNVQCADDVPPPVDLTATDNCDDDITVSPSAVITPGNCANQFTMVRTWTFVDQCGNSSSVKQTITVHDDTPPSITCPPDVTVNCLEDVPPPDFEGGMVSDNCDPNPRVEHVGDVEGSLCPTVIMRQYKATDECGNTSVCFQAITVTDNGPTLIVACPSSVVEDANQTPEAIALSWNAWIDEFKTAVSGGCDPTVTYYFNNNPISLEDLCDLPPPDACGSAGDVVKVEASDLCQSKSCEASYLVLAFTGGEVNVDNREDCQTSVNPPTKSDAQPFVDDILENLDFEPPVCLGDVVPTITPTLTGPTVNGNIYCFKLIVMVEAGPYSDEGEGSICITWAPPITLYGVPGDVTVDCEDDLPPWPVVTATGGVPVIRLQTPGFSSCGGAFYERRWRAVDACGNVVQRKQTIRLSDNEAPELTIPDDLVVNCFDPVPEPNYSVSDNCSSVDVDVEEARTDHSPCTYTLVRTYTARDGCGNTTVKTQTIEVVDNQGPTITPVNPMLQNVPNGGEVTMFGCETPQVLMSDFAVTDDCCAPIQAITTDELVASNVCPEFGYHRRWVCIYEAEDAAGNKSEFRFYVLQFDNTSPELLNIPPDLEVSCGSTVGPPPTDVEVNDDCSFQRIPEFEETFLVDPDNSEKQAIIRTWSFTDACGNRGEQSQMISICGFDASMASSAVGNTIWLDENENGLQDVEEVGINDLKVTLYKHTEMGEIKLDSINTSSLDGVSGQFLFHHLMPGMYKLEVEIPANMYVTLQKQGANDTIDSDANQLTGYIDSIVVHTQQMLTNYDIGLTYSALILPIELKTLNASSSDCINTIEWVTVSEVGCDRFEVQRAFETGGFHTISTVAANGGEHIETHYAVQDASAQSMSKYRIKMIDLDGTYSYSEIITVQLDCDDLGEEVTVYPNPASEFIYVDFNIKKSVSVDIQVIDKLGRVLLTEKRAYKKGHQIDEIKLKDLPPGMYMLSINSGRSIVNKAIVKTE